MRVLPAKQIISKYLRNTGVLALCRVLAVASVLTLLLVASVAILFSTLRGDPAPIKPDFKALSEKSFDLPKSYDVPPRVVERPLFWSSRTRYVAPINEPVEVAVVEAKPNDSLKDVEVIGVLGSGKNSTAVLKVKQQYQRVSLDQVFKGWRLVQVFPNGVIFVLDSTVNADSSEGKEILIKRREPLSTEWQGPKNLLK